MAIRLDASADKLSRSANLPGSSAFSFGGWFKFASTPGTYSNTIFDLSANTNNYIYLQAESGTMKLWGYLAGSDQGTLSLNAYSTATWYYYAATRNGTSFKAYYGAVGSALTEVSGTWAATTFTPSLLQIGDSVWTGEWTDGTLAYAKLWDGAQLTLAELEQERYAIRPVRTANLYGFWPAFPGATERLADYSGNGYSWTAGGTLADEDGPPVSWGAPVIVVPYTAAAGGITGSAAITEDSDTLSSTGALAIAGAAAITEAADTLSSASTLAIAGAASIAEANDTLSAASTLALTASAAITEAADTVSSAGVLPIVGTATITESADTLSATGVLPIVGALAGTEADDTLFSTGTLPIVGQASITEADDTLTAASSESRTGTASITEDNDTASATGTLAIAGVAAVTENDDTLTATGTVNIAAIAALVEQADTLIATAVLAIAGQAAITEDNDTLIAYQTAPGLPHYRIAETVIMPYSAAQTLIFPYTVTQSLIWLYAAAQEIEIT